MNEFDAMLGDITYDSVTGQEDLKVAEDRQDIVKQQAIDEGEKLASLAKHPGWKLVKNMMEQTIQKETHALLHARNMDFITFTQALIKSRTDLLGWLEIKMFESKTLLEEEQ